MAYDQPFYVGTSPEMRRRFPHARNGWLPALELTDGPASIPRRRPDTAEEEHRDHVLLIDLENRLNKHIDASKRKRGPY